MFIVSGAAASDLTGPKCNANTVHWTYDTWMLANGTGKAMVKTGGDTWFFLTADYAFGHALERDTTAVVEANGGKVLGSVRHPLNTSDFSSFLLQAQASKAKVIGLANAGGDTINSIKQARRVRHRQGRPEARRPAGVRQRRRRARPADRAGPGPDRDLVLGHERRQPRLDQALAGSERPGKFPTMIHAGVYAGVTALPQGASRRSRAAADGKAVVAKMKEMPTDDPLFGKGTIRADGRKIHPAYLFEVKKPAESKYPGDFYKLRATIPADEAFRPLKDGGCPLVERLTLLVPPRCGRGQRRARADRGERRACFAARDPRPDLSPHGARG